MHPPQTPLSVIYLCYNGDDGTTKVDSIDYEKHELKSNMLNLDIALDDNINKSLYIASDKQITQKIHQSSK